MRARWAWAVVFVIGASIRAAPVDMGIVTESWREADMSMIARHYFDGTASFAMPRVDWGGDGPGFVESEFPLYPWLVAQVHRSLGYSETNGRMLSVLVSLVALLGFFSLCRRQLQGPGALAAGLFFALSPLAFAISYTLQPDGLMFAGSIWAVLAFLRWLDSGRAAWGIASAACLGLAILVKVVALHLGLLLVFVIVSREGIAGLRRARYWAFAAVALLPAIAWYAHARRIFEAYGNSLGISNESHWVGGAFFEDPHFVRGIVHNQVAFVWMPAGAALILAGLALRRLGRPQAFALAWLGSTLVYLVAIAGTAADDWAFYYHSVSVPAVALLFGAAIEVAGWGGASPPLRFGQAALARTATAVAVVGLAVLAYAQEARALARLEPGHQRSPLLECARDFAPRIPTDALVLVTGGPCVDEDGRPVAYNASYFFYWMDRRGWSACRQQQSVEGVSSYARRGARYFVAERGHLRESGAGVERELRERFGVLAECSGAILFDLAGDPR